MVKKRRLNLRDLSPGLQAIVLETERRLAVCIEKGGHVPSSRLTEPRLAPGVPGIKRMTHVRMVICGRCDIPFKVGEDISA